MKTLEIIVGVLAITTVVYSSNTERLRKFYNDVQQCSEEFGGSISELNAGTLKCALNKDGKVFDDNGAYIKEETLQMLIDFISDTDKLNQAQTIWLNCYDDAVKAGGSTVDEQTMKIVQCVLPIGKLIDKVD